LTLFCVGFQVACYEWLLYPAGPALLDRNATLVQVNDGLVSALASAGWIAMSTPAGLLVNYFGVKGQHLTNSLVSGIAALGLTVTVALYEYSTLAPPLFWTAFGILSYAQVELAILAFVGLSSHFRSGAQRTMAIGVAVSSFAFGLAAAGGLHLRLVRDPLIHFLSDRFPSVAFPSQLATCVLITAIASVVHLIGLPFVRKNGKFELGRYEARCYGRCGRSMEAICRVEFLQASAFCLSWLFAASAPYFLLYMTPRFTLAKGFLVDGTVADPALLTLVLGGGTALGTPLTCLLATNAQPIWAIAIGAIVSCLGPASMIAVGFELISIPFGVALALSLVVIGQSLWWPRMISYATSFDPSPYHYGSFVASAMAVLYWGRGLAAPLVSLVLNLLCNPSTATHVCPMGDTRWLWLVTGTIPLVGTLCITLPALALTVNRAAMEFMWRRPWYGEMDVVTDEEMSRLNVTLEDSDEDDLAEAVDHL
jgi:hypothetical protein